MTNVAIIYYSATGTNHQMAQAVAEGAAGHGAGVRLRLVEETAPRSAIESRDAWKAFVEKTKDAPRASGGDLEWADAVIFGTPTRYGNMTSQLKAFIDSLGGLWMQGKLADKVYAGFTSAQNPHGGQESTLLALYTTIHHFGGYIVTPGYTDEVTFASGGNPYGPSVTVGQDLDGPTKQDLEHCRFLGRRVTEVATRLVNSAAR